MKIVLVQLPVPNDRLVNLPLALGYLKAAAESPEFVAGVRGFGAVDDGLPFPALRIELLAPAAQNRGGDAYIVEAILARSPDMIGFSLYTWNSSRTLTIARMLKARAPELIIIGGGPEVDPAANFVLAESACDFLIHGEGEATFVQLIDHFERGTRNGALELREIAGLACKNESGTWHFNAPRYALTDVNLVPSAYLSGAMDAHFSDGGLRGFIALELSRWCPSKCTFCYYGRQNIQRGGKRYFDLERVRAEFDFARAAGSTRIHLIEANFNTLPHLNDLFEQIEKMGLQRTMGFYAELRGEAVDDALADRLAALNFGPLEVGLQATDPAVLARVRRKNNLVRLAAGVHHLRRRGIDVFLDVILGLPGETPPTFQATLDWLAANDLAPYDLFPLQILAGTQLKAEVDNGSAFPDADGRGHGITYQPQPPYFVTGTAELDFTSLARLRADFITKQGGDPAHIDGLPEPDSLALATGIVSGESNAGDWLPVSDALPVERLILAADALDGLTRKDAEQAGRALAARLSSQVTILADFSDMTDQTSMLEKLSGLLAGLSTPNLSGVWHIFVRSQKPVALADLTVLGQQIAHQEGYLDRLGIFATTRTATGLPLSVGLWNIVPAEMLPANAADFYVGSGDGAHGESYVVGLGHNPARVRDTAAHLAHTSRLWFESALAERAYREAKADPAQADDILDPIAESGIGTVTLHLSADVLRALGSGADAKALAACRLSRAALDTAELRAMVGTATLHRDEASRHLIHRV